jgi:hypothetical protein
MRAGLGMTLLLLLPLLGGCEAVQKGAKDLKSILEPKKPVEVEPEPEREREKPRTPPPEVRRSGGEDTLASGITLYEEGNYGQAQKLLLASISEGLPVPADKARAHKHLAFIHCITERVALCRQEFRNALAADPGFVLTTAEAGHPRWGPVYRSVKGR